jgi:hypothetical protein
MTSPELGLTLCMSTLADSTGPKGEKIWSSVAELVVPGILPIQTALVGRADCSDCCSGEPATPAPVPAAIAAAVADTPGGTGTAPMEPLVNTRPEGAAATEEEEGPFGAESILPKPIRTGAVSERAVM